MHPAGEALQPHPMALYYATMLLYGCLSNFKADQGDATRCCKFILSEGQKNLREKGGASPLFVLTSRIAIAHRSSRRNGQPSLRTNVDLRPATAG